MKEKIQSLLEEINSYSGSSAENIEKFRVKYISKKSVVNDLFEEFKKLSIDEKKKFGKTLNELKNVAKEKLISLSNSSSTSSKESNNIDFSLPPEDDTVGSLHPLRIIRNKIIKIFRDIGFSIEDGPEVEKDWYNFTALNFPENHPAREMQDTFYIEDQDDENKPFVLRTHTSPVQIRTMLSQEPPIKIIAPGRTYRCDSDATHSPMFHQVEGLFISKTANMSDLKGTLIEFCKQFFEVQDLKVRFRPSYFPFTEPSAEMDIAYHVKNNSLHIGEGDKWLEILGCGMVNPVVLENCKIDNSIYQGFAFGMGLDRITMLKHGLTDIRAFFNGNLNWINQNGFGLGDY